MRTILASAIFLFSAAVTVTIPRAAEDDRTAAPFGLRWGMLSSEVRALGVEFKDVPFKEYGSSAAAAKLPKVIADVASVVLSFGFDDKLWRIAAVSRDFANDPHGSAVRSRYDELESELVEKYGRGEQHHQSGEGFYAKPETFVYAIETGNAWYYTNHVTNNLKVQLSIRASGPSTAFYQVIFQNKALRLEFEESKKMHEKDSL